MWVHVFVLHFVYGIGSGSDVPVHEAHQSLHEVVHIQQGAQRLVPECSRTKQQGRCVRMVKELTGGMSPTTRRECKGWDLYPRGPWSWPVSACLLLPRWRIADDDDDDNVGGSGLVSAAAEEESEEVVDEVAGTMMSLPSSAWVMNIPIINNTDDDENNDEDVGVIDVVGGGRGSRGMRGP